VLIQRRLELQAGGADVVVVGLPNVGAGGRGQSRYGERESERQEGPDSEQQPAWSWAHLPTCVQHSTMDERRSLLSETVAEPRLKKARRGGRALRPSDNHRKADKRKNSEERGASSGVRMRTPREGALSGDGV